MLDTVVQPKDLQQSMDPLLWRLALAVPDRPGAVARTVVPPQPELGLPRLGVAPLLVSELPQVVTVPLPERVLPRLVPAPMPEPVLPRLALREVATVPPETIVLSACRISIDPELLHTFHPSV